MLALARSCSNNESAIGIPGDLRRAVRGHVQLHHRPGRQRRRLVLRVGLLTQADQRVGGPMFEAVPRLTLGRLHLLGQPLDRRFERRPHHIGQLPVQVQHPLVRRPPHPQRPRLVPRPRILRRRLHRAAGQPGQLHRRDPRRPPGPLPVAELVGQLGDRAQLLRTQRTLVRGRGDLGQRLQPSRGLQLVPQRARRLTLITQRRIDATALVEHPQNVELLDLQPTLRAHHLVPTRHQPIRRPRPQLIEMIDHVEHAPIKPSGYDTDPSDSVASTPGPRRCATFSRTP